MIGSIAYNSSPLKIWMPLSGDAATVFYEGAIVTTVKGNSDLTQDGLLLSGAAAGAADTTAKKPPFGIITGFNTMSPTYTSGRQTGTAVASASLYGSTAEYMSSWSNHSSPNEGRLHAEVAIIDPSTYVKMPIFVSAWGTALSVRKATAASSAGGAVVVDGNPNFTTVNGLQTCYCRKGGNAGCYRITSGAGDTTTWTAIDEWKNNIAIGDEFLTAPLRLGTSYLQLDATGTYIEGSASPATSYYTVTCVEINLQTAGEEYAIFRFNTTHFDFERA